MKNRISAVITNGNYKDSLLEIQLGPHARNTKVLIDRKPIKCTGLWIKCIPGKLTKVTIEKLVD